MAGENLSFQTSIIKKFSSTSNAAAETVSPENKLLSEFFTALHAVNKNHV